MDAARAGSEPPPCRLQVQGPPIPGGGGHVQQGAGVPAPDLGVLGHTAEGGTQDVHIRTRVVSKINAVWGRKDLGRRERGENVIGLES